VPFYNADIIEKIAVKTGLFRTVLRQNREFKNKFGKMIREDILNFSKLNYKDNEETIEKIAREVALDVLTSGRSWVSAKNILSLEAAIQNVKNIKKTVKLYHKPF
jgi:hypothetical protein